MTLSLEVIRDIVAGYVPQQTPGEFSTRLTDAHLKLFFRLYADRDSDSLRPFRKVKGEGSVPLIFKNGTASIPSDYFVFESAYTNTSDGPVEVQFLDDREYDWRLVHKIEYPDAQHPIGNIQSDYIRIRPASVHHIVFSYYTSPGELTYVVTTARGFMEFDSELSSTNPWNATATVMLIQLLLQSYGVVASKEEIASKVGASNNQNNQNK